jgi:hypothetical protein
MSKKKEKKVKRVVEVKTIGLHLDSIKEAYSPFSYESNYMLNPDFVDYIEDSAKHEWHPGFTNFEINIYSSNVIKEKDQEKFIANYRKSYEAKKILAFREIRKARKIGVIFFLMGFSMLIIAHLISTLWTSAPNIVNFFFEIASWVFMWESVDTYFISKHVKVVNFEFLDTIDDAKINFIKEDKEIDL